jgi:hypothetical protein
MSAERLTANSESSEKIFLPWSDMFRVVVARSEMEHFVPDSKIFQGIVPIEGDSSRVGVKVCPSMVLSDGYPRIVLVNLYAVSDEAEEHIQSFIANSVWKDAKEPVVLKVDEILYMEKPPIRIKPEEAGRMALEVTMNLNSLMALSQMPPPARLQ